MNSTIRSLPKTLTLVLILILACFTVRADLLVSSYLQSCVLRYSEATGAYLGTFVPTASGGLRGAEGLVFGRDGSLYVSETLGNRILRYDGTTGAFLGTFASEGLTSP